MTSIDSSVAERGIRLSFQSPIAYHRELVEVMGSVSGAVFLSQLCYWASTKDDWFYKTDAQIRDETGLTDRELRAAKKALGRIDFVSVARRGVPAKTWYHVDFMGLNEWLGTRGSVPSSSDDAVQSSSYDGVQTGSNDAVQTITETTTETTADRDKPRRRSSSQQGSRVPEDFTLTPDRLEVARSRGLDRPEAEEELEKFLDYWRSIPGQKGRKADWEATWRNWVRNAVKFRQPNGKNGHRPDDEDPFATSINRHRWEGP